MSQLWLFTRLEGEGDHEFWAELYRIVDPEDELIAAHGPFIVPFGTGLRAYSRAWRLQGVPFFTPGWYEFRLKCGDEIVGTESMFLED